jgi:hypothetical protein
MSKELLKKLKVGDKVWVELVVDSIGEDRSYAILRDHVLGDEIGMDYNSKFRVYNPNELSVREILNYLKNNKETGVQIYQDGQIYLDDAKGDSKELDLDGLQFEIRTSKEDKRKIEIKKQIEELQKELNSL